MCYFCDFVENTNAKDDTATLVELTQKYLDILNSKHGNSEMMAHTVAYGLGEFGYFIPTDKFAKFLPDALAFIKPVAYAPDAFEEDNLEKTENYMGALIKLAYKHLDTHCNLTKKDVIHVLSHMPFTSDDVESKMTHKLFIDAVRNKNPRLLTPEVQPHVE